MNERMTHRLRRAAHLILAVVAVVGVVLSWDSLYEAAKPTFGPVLAAGFPLLADALAAGASLMYVSGARHGQGRAGWRLTAHAAIATTITLNALAAPTLSEVPWHVTAPAVWSVLVELYAREAAGEWKAEHAGLAERIPGRLWLTAPIESTRTWLRIARRVEGEQAAARLDVGLYAAAVEALRLALPAGTECARVRRILVRQLRAGSMPPVAVLAAVGWTGEQVERTPEAVLRAALRGVLTGDDTAVPETVEAAPEVTVEVVEPAPVPAPPVAALPAPEPPQAPAKPGAEQTGARATDADLLARITAMVDTNQLRPEEVTNNRLRTLLSVGPTRAARLAAAWAEQHRRAAIRPVRTV